MSDAKPEPRSFEDIVKRLEVIAKQLENGNTKLEDAVKLFEEGVQLANTGKAELDRVLGGGLVPGSLVQLNAFTRADSSPSAKSRASFELANGPTSKRTLSGSCATYGFRPPIMSGARILMRLNWLGSAPAF